MNKSAGETFKVRLCSRDGLGYGSEFESVAKGWSRVPPHFETSVAYAQRTLDFSTFPSASPPLRTPPNAKSNACFPAVAQGFCDGTPTSETAAAPTIGL